MAKHSNLAQAELLGMVGAACQLHARRLHLTTPQVLLLKEYGRSLSSVLSFLLMLPSLKCHHLRHYKIYGACLHLFCINTTMSCSLQIEKLRNSKIHLSSIKTVKRKCWIMSWTWTMTKWQLKTESSYVYNFQGKLKSQWNNNTLSFNRILYTHT